jgi:molybdopterin molybdotransferase
MKDMLGRNELISVDEALELIFSSVLPKKLEEIEIPIDEAYGLVASRDVISPEDLPDFNRSTVDGFAVNSMDTFGASENSPAYLNIFTEIKMGERPEFYLKRGFAAKIATGGMLPEGSDSVVMFEHVSEVNSSIIEISKSVSPGENVVQRGEDIKQGELVVQKGKRLRPQDVGALAGLGITNVYVYRMPRVSIISTGDEVVPIEIKPSEGQVRDINSYSLKGLVMEAHCLPIIKGLFKDDYESLKDVVRESLDSSDLIIITGGSSVGLKDLTAVIINELGKPGVIFHGVSLKPGKPTIFGMVNEVPIFGLPGHPSAVIICFKIFIEPILKFISGVKDGQYSHNKMIRVRIAKNVSSSPGREEHIPVIIEEADGELWAVPLFGKSGYITTLSKADGTAIIPLRKTGVKSGDFVDVRLF